MTTNLSVLIKNNLIAIVAHVCICCFFPMFFLIATYIWEFGIWYGPELEWVIFNLVSLAVYTITALLLYFWAGRKYLKNTQHLPTIIFSLTALTILIPLMVFITYDSTWGWGYLLSGLMLFEPIGETISHFLQIDRMYAFLILTPFPSLTMLAGLITK